MKTSIKMKYTFLAFGFFIFSFTFAHGQDNRLIYSETGLRTTERVAEVLQRNRAYMSVDFVRIDLEKIRSFEQFTLQFEERNILINKERIDVRGANSFWFVGGNNEGNRIYLSILDNDVQGVIETPTGIFSVVTTGNDEYAIVKVDQSKFREAEPLSIDFEDVFDHENENITTSSTLRAHDCKIRVLVLYTPNAVSKVSNIKNTVSLAINLTNESFIRSGVNHRIELAYAGPTNYTESHYSADLYNFRVDGNGYMDEVHALRNRYSADISVLLTYDINLCGVAYMGPVSEDFAFAIVSSDCIAGNYTFAHEIGHLLGCHHDHHISTNTTIPYGHGYVHNLPSNRWITIMASPSSACVGCPRILNWSNPDVDTNGIAMGTHATNNNARVWNEQSSRVAAFRQPGNNVVVTGNDVSNGIYIDIIAKQNITTNGTVNIRNGSSVSMRAGNSITFGPGFSVEAGATFSATIENINDCGN
ncbi:MAG: zinc-dependent metalloprotease [Chitinispirillales bacterium]|jgi:hypothetical protein|nr:zinc-dependent metalloprotease [Chitinispirillales bacterium]